MPPVVSITPIQELSNAMVDTHLKMKKRYL